MAGSANKGQDAANIVTAACVFAVGSATAAEAQQAPAPLSPVTVDAPIIKHRPVVAKPTKTQLRVRTALRHKARQAQHVAAAPARASGPASAPTAAPGTGLGAAGLPTFAQVTSYEDPYANPAAPYMAERLSSNKFTQPIVNTPRSVTVLTREVLDDENATSLRDIGRSTAGVTLGSGEGGNAFGDRFFIRGFDARNDIFVDGIRDPGVSIRENFFTEQVEILRGPASSFAGRGTTGGAINIVTKKAADQDFDIIETTIGSDQTSGSRSMSIKSISPILDVRINGMVQGADVAGRDFTTDDRNGVAGALTFKPIPGFTLMADYSAHLPLRPAGLRRSLQSSR